MHCTWEAINLAFLRRLEDALGSVIDGGLARLDGGGVHPLEIARRLQAEMTEGRLLGMEPPWAPNRYRVRLSERDFAHFGEIAAQVSAQIARQLQRYADEEDWATGDGVSVRIESGGRRAGVIEVESSFDEQAPGARVVVVAGQPGRGDFVIREQAVIGRDPDCDVRLDEAAVSRRHAEIEWNYEGYLLRDLGSSNGTFVNSMEIDEVLLEDGDLIEVGLVQMRFRRPGR